jgi:plasmid maintenance system antidote protein VapI
MLKELIRNSGLKQNFIAAKIGVSTAYFSDVVTGKRRLTAEHAMKIHQQFGFPLHQLRADLWKPEAA